MQINKGARIKYLIFWNMEDSSALVTVAGFYKNAWGRLWSHVQQTPGCFDLKTLRSISESLNGLFCIFHEWAFTNLILCFKVVLHKISPHQFEILKTDNRWRTSRSARIHFPFTSALNPESQTNFSVIWPVRGAARRSPLRHFRVVQKKMHLFSDHRASSCYLFTASRVNLPLLHQSLTSSNKPLLLSCAVYRDL